MTRQRKIVDASKMGGHGLRLIGTTDIDGNGTPHEIADVDPIVLFDFGKFNTRNELPFRPHPHLGLTAMSFLPVNGTFMAWDSIEGETEAHLHAGGLYYVHAGSPAFHYEFPSPETVAAEIDMEFVQLVWNATDEEDVKTVIIQPEAVPVITSENGSVRVLAGEFCGVKSVQPFTHRKIIYAYVQLQNGKTMDLHVPSSMKGILFAIEGNLKVNEATVNARQMMILGDEDHLLSITNLGADSISRFIIAAGEPLNKPFYKMIGLGGFIIGKTEDEVRSKMEQFAAKAEQLKKEIPQYFPAQYL
ncbi:MAG: pirin-like C-terminal cupin domain-containing protein [Arenicellales bacterium]